MNIFRQLVYFNHLNFISARLEGKARGQQIRSGQRHDLPARHKTHRHGTVGELGDHLPARPARWELQPPCDHRQTSNAEGWTLRRHTGEDRVALRANRQSIGSVLYIAAPVDFPGFSDQGAAHQGLRIRRIGSASGRFSQGYEVLCGHLYSARNFTFLHCTE